MAVEAGGIGARLRACREKLGLTVLQVAERIHTDPKIVEAIEAENYEALGAPVYARGHIRHYAELVGESGSELNQLYSNLSKVAQPDLTRIVKAPAGTNSSKLVAPALLVIAVFAVAGAIWWVSALSKKKPQLSDTHVVGDEVPAAGGTSPGADSSGVSGTSASTQEPGQVGSPTTSADHGPPPGAMAMQGRPGQAGSTSAGAMAMRGRPGQQGSPPPGAMTMQPRPGQAGSTSTGAMTMQPRPGQAGSTPAGAMTMQGRPGQAGSPPSAMAMQSRQGNTGPGGATSSGVAPAPGRSGTAGSPAATSGQARSASGSGAASGGSVRPVPAPQAGRTSSSGSASTQTRSAAAQARTASATPAGAAAAAATAGAGAATIEPATATPSAAPPRAKNQSQVTLHYSADSWTEVYDASGARLFYDVGAANSVQTVVGTPPLRVVLGNASGVSVEYNGHNKPIAKLSRPDGSVQFSINRSGKVVRAKPVADGG
jgi:cytoskeletal protein RodZ